MTAWEPRNDSRIECRGGGRRWAGAGPAAPPLRTARAEEQVLTTASAEADALLAIIERFVDRSEDFWRETPATFDANGPGVTPTPLTGWSLRRQTYASGRAPSCWKIRPRSLCRPAGGQCDSGAGFSRRLDPAAARDHGHKPPCAAHRRGRGGDRPRRSDDPPGRDEAHRSGTELGRPGRYWHVRVCPMGCTRWSPGTRRVCCRRSPGLNGLSAAATAPSRVASTVPGRSWRE